MRLGNPPHSHLHQQSTEKCNHGYFMPLSSFIFGLFLTGAKYKLCLKPREQYCVDLMSPCVQVILFYSTSPSNTSADECCPDQALLVLLN